MSLSSFHSLISKNLIVFIENQSPQKVLSRVAKAANHYEKACKLRDIDNEMAAIRFIAAEEELVVAIFEIFKIYKEHMPEHDAFIKKYKNHLVKLSFYPAVSVLREIVENFFLNGLAIPIAEGYEASFGLAPKINDHDITLCLLKENEEEVISVSPFQFTITQEENHKSVVDKIFDDFKLYVGSQGFTSVKDFIHKRSNFRNQLLYAEDAGFIELGQSFEELDTIFQATYRDLLWCIAIMLRSDHAKTNWNILSQFIDLYVKILIEGKVIRSS